MGKRRRLKASGGGKVLVQQGFHGRMMCADGVYVMRKALYISKRTVILNRNYTYYTCRYIIVAMNAARQRAFW